MTWWCESSELIYIGGMKAKYILDWIRSDISDAKQQGQDSIAVSALEKYLDHLENELTDVESLGRAEQESELAKYRAENERNLAHYNARQVLSVEMFRSVIALGQSALKSAMVINGAAAAALMAFIGNLVVKQADVSAVQSLSGSIAYFSAGVLVAAFAMATTYFSQFSYSQDWFRWGI
ncbi:MAG TPA: hypothetical protein ENH27_01070, partial [Rhizobiales bacterium]|nr:hypothetical protein [Hyphomicrobiales bacterium]